jgi:hypothetical protein
MEVEAYPEAIAASKRTRTGALWMIAFGIACLSTGGGKIFQMLHHHKLLDPLEVAMIGICFLLAPLSLYRSAQLIRFLTPHLGLGSESPVPR